MVSVVVITVVEVVSEVVDSYVELDVVRPVELLEEVIVSSAVVLLLLLVERVRLVLSWEEDKVLFEVEVVHMVHSLDTSAVVWKTSAEVVVSHGQT